MTMESKVFLSYSREKRGIIQRLKDILEENDITVWWDHNLGVGDKWMEVIAENISANDYFILCISSDLEKKPDSYVFEELKQATDNKKKANVEVDWLIPVVIDYVHQIPDFPIDLEHNLNNIHCQLLFDEHWNDGIDKILTRILPDFTIRPRMILVPPLRPVGFSEKEIKMKPFLLGKYPVTIGEWYKVKNERPIGGDPNRPVTMVTWEEVQDFLHILNKTNSNKSIQNYRLPTEAEWEYACRAGTSGKYGFQGGAELLEEYAWYIENSGGKTHRVGELRPNGWGFYDMHGNVCEWVQDTKMVERTSTHSGIEAITKGGSFDGYAEEHCRVEKRTWLTSIHRYNNLGFRIACDAKKDLSFVINSDHSWYHTISEPQ